MALLRDATPEDLGGIFAIYDDAVRRLTATLEWEPSTEAGRRDWFGAYPRDAYPIVVAETESGTGGIAGWARLTPWSPRPGYSPTCEDAVYVAEAQRGRGLGRRLLGALIECARARERRLVMARIVEGNPGSRALHEAMGFRTIGVMPCAGLKFGQLIDVRLMGLSLEAPHPAADHRQEMP
jgi:phosphinothricin acetyltransferase